MKYIKAYEQHIYTIDNNSIVKFLNKIIKKVEYKHYKHSIYFTNTNRISLYENSNPDFTEIISQIYTTNTNVLIFNVFAPKYILNDMLIKYFSMSMELVYERDYLYSFKFDRNTKLNSNDFEILLNSNKYNL
jgi:hypothetical protein